MRIGVIGNGVVGNATGKASDPHVDEVRYWDVIDAKCTHSLHDTVCGTDLVFVCLPTPQCKDSLACDVSIVDQFFNVMRDLDGARTQNYVLRSTVPVGYTRTRRELLKIPNLVHSPEFLTARTAEEDAKSPTRCIIGDPTYIRIHDEEQMGQCAYLLKQLYDKVFLYEEHGSAIIPDYIPPTYFMTSDESEFVKLMQNTFSAIKIAAFNEFRSFSDVKGLDWERCLTALFAGGWINPMHTQVPGPDGKRGFGGACLPKDTASFIHQLMEAGLKGKVAYSAYERNQLIDRKE